MIVVVEGPDNSGKSTLVKHLASKLGVHYVPGEGPAKSGKEINARVERYHQMDGVIFDRHPCVSQAIYNKFRDSSPSVDFDLTIEFYRKDPLIIYCRGREDLNGHQVKEHDLRKDETGLPHIDLVRLHHRDICNSYDGWALGHAHLLYRIGDGYERITSVVAQHLKLIPDMMRDMENFHRKFDLVYEGPARSLPQDIGEFRMKFMREELEEYEEHHAHCLEEERQEPPDVVNYTYHLEHQLDALVDLVYVALGTAYLQGFRHSFGSAWTRVQEANMAKVRAQRIEDSKRGSTFDVVKPKGWVPPTHIDLVERNDLSLSRGSR